ncbi:MAG: TetR/AcrR family transcriptional regulator; helix-turn-helix transcriptional regulator, partial [candidate division Zixibacteria bacterium]|nr:TetR/AcrR family transcriptional regulator; helix-turn-helix transcriptional regulator [candidate division Zixibacteria bacterium]
MPKIVDKEARRRDIARAALRVFGHRGIHSFKMADIAKEAGIGKGTVYEFFRSKREWISNAFVVLLEEYSLGMVPPSTELRTPADRIRDMISGTFSFFGDDEERLRFGVELWQASLPRRNTEPLFDDLPAVFNEYRTGVIATVNEGMADGS